MPPSPAKPKRKRRRSAASTTEEADWPSSLATEMEKPPAAAPADVEEKDEGGECFERVRRELTIPLHPWQLGGDAGALVAEQLRCRLHRHVPSLGGILHSVDSLRLLASADAGRRRLAAPLVACGPSLVQCPVRLRLHCRLFRPRPGLSLACTVTAVLPELLSCVCHGVYQVTVAVPPATPTLAPGDRVLARVVRVRTHSRLQVSVEAEFVAILPDRVD
ncbi:hypothetical protein BOX15_Mlig003325g1 [Macrostomum lignano]|uniref:Uncharacterized protein n=1 Tax=Macrostomum lignano TaxID=282301 RepID=A0A267F6Z9_9PLAT|nr:hypothetical protein BOX15_Mlig003325g1 [Macrostomum lignano]